MRRLIALAVAGIAVAVPVGCCTQTCPGDYPIVRQDELLRQSEDTRSVDKPLHPFRGEQDKPTDQTPVRIHGGIL